MNYDYIIVGGGPTGLTLAWCLSKYGNKVALIDKNDSLGGCHRVHRVNGLFSEHGPRVYDYNNILGQILNEMNLNFYNLFTKYNVVSATSSSSQITNKLSMRELLIILYRFLLINKNDKNITTLEFMIQYNFSSKAIQFIDALCRLISGINSDNYLLYDFLYNINSFAFAKMYQPKNPNDTHLFKFWGDALIKQNVDIYLNTTVNNITNNSNKIISIICNNIELKGNNFILAIPPYNITQILNSIPNNQIKDAFGELTKWSNDTNYIIHIPIIFHWNNKLNLKKIWGFPSAETAWELIFIVLSDYMDFNDDRSLTVISICINKHKKSDYTNKTPNETSNKDELITETFRQLQIIFPNLPKASYALVSQNNHNGKEWVPNDTAFAVSKYGFIKSKSNIFDNLYNCGTQILINSHITTIGTAINSAIALLHKLEPKSIKDYSITNDTTIHDILYYIIISLCIIYIIKKLK
jgi:hypothetical protein